MKVDVQKVIDELKREYPEARIALNFSSNWELLVAVVLSAQCTDERVNKVTPPLFRKFVNVEAFAAAPVEEIEKMIYSTGFYKNKAKNVKAAAQRIVNEFGGEVPGNMEDLLSLAGVARKTANVVLYTGFGKVEGIVVDTHVARLAGRLEWVDEEMSKKKKAVQIEKKLMEIVRQEEWGGLAHLLILHGRQVCKAKNPKCAECRVRDLCPSANKFL